VHEATVQGLMVKWSYWKMSSGVALGFKSRVSYVRLAAGKNLPDLALESDCVMTDEAYKQLPALHRVVIDIEYLASLRSRKDRAREFGRSIYVYGQCLQEAHQKIGVMFEHMMKKRLEAVD